MKKILRSVISVILSLSFLAGYSVPVFSSGDEYADYSDIYDEPIEAEDIFYDTNGLDDEAFQFDDEGDNIYDSIYEGYDDDDSQTYEDPQNEVVDEYGSDEYEYIDDDPAGEGQESLDNNIDNEWSDDVESSADEIRTETDSVGLDVVSTPSDSIDSFEESAISAAEDAGYDASSGTFGSNLTWSLDESGVLTISGTGDMEANVHYSKFPWYASRASITEIIVEEGVTSICDHAFIGCTNVNTVTLPDNLVSIGIQAFSYCKSLEEIELPDELLVVKDFAFSYSSYVRMIIPDSVNEMGEGVFNECKYLTEAHLPENLTVLGQGTFRGCTQLVNVNMPKQLEEIGYSAFEGTQITEMEIPATLNSMGYHIFCKCQNLTKVRFRGDVPANWEKGALFGFSGTVYYPRRYNSWTADVMQTMCECNYANPFWEPGFIEQYTGAVTWEPYSIGLQVSLPIEQQVMHYTGEDIFPLPSVTDLDDNILTEWEDYTLSYENNTVPGKGTVIATGIGDYTGISGEAEFEIRGTIEAVLEQNLFALEIDGEEVNAEPVVSFEGNALTKDRDYTLSYENNSAEGEASVCITGIGYYEGEIEFPYYIVSVKGLEERFVYTGEEIKPSVTLSAGDAVLTEGTDYTVTYNKNINVGYLAEVKITGKGSYSGELLQNFVICPRPVEGLEIIKYTGKIELQWKPREEADGYQVLWYLINEEDPTQIETNVVTIGEAEPELKEKLDQKGLETLEGKEKISYRIRSDLEFGKYYRVEILTETNIDDTERIEGNGKELCAATIEAEPAAIATKYRESYFEIGTDSNSFPHRDIASYDMTEEMIERLSMDLNTADRERLRAMVENDTWNGSCHGLSLVMAEVKAGNLDISGFPYTGENTSADFYHLESPLSNTILKDWINYYYYSQKLTWGDVSYKTSHHLSLSNSLDLGVFWTRFLVTMLEADAQEVAIPLGYGFSKWLSNGNLVSPYYHTILACGLDSENDEYEIITLYNCNKKDEYDYLFIKKTDPSQFFFSDRKDKLVDVSDTYPKMLNYIFFKCWDQSALERIQNHSGSDGSLSSDNTTGVVIHSDQSIEITTEDGHTMHYNGSEYSGDLSLIDVRHIISDTPEEIMLFEQLGSFTVKQPVGGGKVGYLLADKYIEIEADGADAIEIDSTGNVTILGSSSKTFRIVMPIADSTDLVEISGTLRGEGAFSYDNQNINMETTGAFTDVIVEKVGDNDGGTESSSLVFTGGVLDGSGSLITAENDHLGSLNDTAGWMLDDNGTLYITGKGSIPDYEYNDGEGDLAVSSAPWASYLNDIQTLIISNKITGIGSCAFSGMVSLEKAEIPASVTEFGEKIFAGSSDVVVYGDKDSGAELYAKDNSLLFIDPTRVEYAVISGISDKTYTGATITQDPVVELAGQLLTPEQDYTVSYENNINAGEATVTITGTGTLSGSAAVPFVIKTKSLKTAEVSAISDKTYTGKVFEPKPVVTLGTKALVLNQDYYLAYKNNTNVGKATIAVKGMGNYSNVAVRYFNIKAASVKNASITGITSKVYTGSALTQKPVVKIGGKTLKLNTDYYLAYKNNTNTGRATIAIKGKGNYSNVAVRYFAINPKPSWIASLSSPKTKQIKITWGKRTQISGYQLEISTKKDFSSSKMQKNVYDPAKLSMTVTVAKANTTYYVRIRSFKKTSDKTYFSTWSAVKTVKTK